MSEVADAVKKLKEKEGKGNGLAGLFKIATTHKLANKTAGWGLLQKKIKHENVFKHTQNIEVVLEMCVAAMKKTDILKDTPEDTMIAVIRKSTAKFEPKDSVLFKQGDEADGCYIILRGKIAIHAKSAAEVRAEKEAEWQKEREEREQLEQTEKNHEEKPAKTRTYQEIKEEMRKDEESAAAAKKEKIAAEKEKIVAEKEETDLPTELSLDLLDLEEEQEKKRAIKAQAELEFRESSYGPEIIVYQTGQIFGEASLLKDGSGTRGASAICLDICEILTINLEDFKFHLAESIQKAHNQKKHMLMTHFPSASIKNENLITLMYHFKPRRYIHNSLIELPPDHLGVVVRGDIALETNNKLIPFRERDNCDNKKRLWPKDGSVSRFLQEEVSGYCNVGHSSFQALPSVQTRRLSEAKSIATLPPGGWVAVENLFRKQWDAGGRIQSAKSRDADEDLYKRSKQLAWRHRVSSASEPVEIFYTELLALERIFPHVVKSLREFLNPIFNLHLDRAISLTQDSLPKQLFQEAHESSVIDNLKASPFLKNKTKEAQKQIPYDYYALAFPRYAPPPEPEKPPSWHHPHKGERVQLRYINMNKVASKGVPDKIQTQHIFSKRTPSGVKIHPELARLKSSHETGPSRLFSPFLEGMIFRNPSDRESFCNNTK